MAANFGPFLGSKIVDFRHFGLFKGVSQGLARVRSGRFLVEPGKSRHLSCKVKAGQPQLVGGVGPDGPACCLNFLCGSGTITTFYVCRGVFCFKFCPRLTWQ